jgi:hypothetical protein
MNNTGEIPIFFIIGRPRTGTTLLRTLFDAHPNVIIPWECQFIINLYPKYHRIRNWSTSDLENFYDDLLEQWLFKLWTIDRNKLKSDLLASAGENSFSNVCKVVHGNYNSFYEKKELKLFGDKNPGYTIYVDLLKKIYPEAKFIFINRDYRDNFFSIKKVDFELPVASLVVYKWKYFFRQALKAKAKYPESFYILRYEDFVSDPDFHFKHLCDFLGIDFLPEVFDFYKKRKDVNKIFKTERAKRNHASLLNPINTTRTGVWKRKLSKKEIRIADAVAGKYAEIAGYQREFKKASPIILLQAFPGVFYGRFLYFMTAVINNFPYKLRATLLNKGPLFIARSYLNLFRNKK